MSRLTALIQSVTARRTVTLALTALLCAIIYPLLPEEMGEPARRTVIVFIIAAVFWATEVIPLYATSLLVISLQVVFVSGTFPLATDSEADAAVEIAPATFFEPFASPVIILFMGGFLLARAVTRHQVDAAISARILRPVAHRPAMLIFAVMAMTAFFSMWMSNTATTAMMLALITPLLARLPGDSRFARGLILAVPLGANIGGLGTPIGTPPNAVALAALRNAGYDISFVDWMIMAVPLEIVLLIVAGSMLCFIYPPEKDVDLTMNQPPVRLSRKGWATVVILTLAMIAWLTGNLHGIADAAVALIAAAALTALSVLDRRDVDSIDWNILILMWGGLSLGHAMQITGLVDYIVALPMFAHVAGLLLAVAVVILSVGLSTFMSNTAAANLIVPMALALSATQGGQLAVLTALSCSLAMALPVSTPPNAIAFSTGRLPASDLLKTGGLISLLSMVLLLLGYQLVIPRLLGV